LPFYTGCERETAVASLCVSYALTGFVCVPFTQGNVVI